MLKEKKELFLFDHTSNSTCQKSSDTNHQVFPKLSMVSKLYILFRFPPSF